MLIAQASVPERWHAPLLWISAGLALALVYTTVFEVTSAGTLGQSLRSGFANAISMTALGAGLFRLTAYRPGRLGWGAIWHAFFAAGFVFLWMFGIVSLSVFLEGLVSGDWQWWWFSGPGLAWQILQGLATYVMIAVSASYVELVRMHRAREQDQKSSLSSPDRPKLILVRQDEGLIPIDPETIEAVEATGDYVRLIRPQGALLVKLTLSEAERRLSPSGFVRVHRSWLVRLAAIRLIEPIGQGRWRALLMSGEEVVLSKSGMKLMRELIV